ncbi:MAG: glycosyltransferase family 4 protein [Anaerolineales bacterium]|nr:glycosyltransferase family 4 protein [Anaerolineales bacterium]
MKKSDSRKNRLLYLLPRYDAESPEHVYHLYGFLRKLQDRIPLEVIVERVSGSLPEDAAMRPLWIRTPALRWIEEGIRFFLARLRGIKTFYVHYSYTGAIAASIVVRLLGGRVFYWNCSLYKDLRPGAGAPLPARMRQRLYEWMLELSVRACTHLVTGTPRVADYYVRHVGIPPQKIRLLPNFTDVDRFRNVTRTEARKELNLPAGRKVALFLHRVAPRKGAHFLPEIARRLVKEAGPVTFLVAGGGPYLEELHRRVDAEKLSAFFDFRGWIPNREVPLYFRAADLYLMPSEEEGFPRVLLEAMAAGCPFIAFDVGGVRDILPKSMTGCVVERRDMQAFVRQSVSALQNPALRASWSKAGGKQVLLFSEDRVVEAFLRMIDGQALDWGAFLASRQEGI